MEGIIRKVRCRPGRGCLRFDRRFLVIIFALFVLVSCAGIQTQKSPAKGVYHIVKKGETVYSIARAYGIPLQDLAEINNISDVSHIKEGSVIFIPDADQVIDDVMVSAAKARDETGNEPEIKDLPGPGQAKPSGVVEPKPSAEKKVPTKPGLSEKSGEQKKFLPPRTSIEKARPLSIEQKEDLTKEKGRFDWPVQGEVKTRFGIQPNKTYHNWIKILCPAGARIKAAASGTVIFSAGLKDFGETIIVRHAEDYATVYTHLRKRYVKADQFIKKGESIALAGEKDETGGTYIHFEIRLKGKARNPLFYLP